ncbi:MAG: 16S rRNA processing protein RimM [Clostridia bacterium]|nr:16S rRNA processing protein RimM [Clostridia bacterium]
MKELTPYLECAMAVNTHGVKGAVKLENRCDTPKVLASLKRMFINKNGEYTELKVLHSSVQKNMVLTVFEGVDTLEAAIALRGTVFYAAREDFRLRRGDYFIADLIGLPVYDEDSGEVIGKLSDVTNPGAHQVYTIECENGSFMIPNVPEFVRRISLDEDEGIYIHLIEGMRENTL